MREKDIKEIEEDLEETIELIKSEEYEEATENLLELKKSYPSLDEEFSSIRKNIEDNKDDQKIFMSFISLIQKLEERLKKRKTSSFPDEYR